MHAHHSHSGLQKGSFWGQVFVALIVGLVVGSALHTIFEAFEAYRGTALLVSIGVGGIVYFAMRGIHEQEHAATGLVFLLFSVLHTMVDGINLGAALSVSAILATGNALGLLLHEVVRWVASAAFLRKIGWSNSAAWIATIGIAVGVIGLTATAARELVLQIPYSGLVAAGAAGGTLALVLPHVAPQMWTLNVSPRARVLSVSLALIFAAGAFQAASLGHDHDHAYHEDHGHHEEDGHDHDEHHDEDEEAS